MNREDEVDWEYGVLYPNGDVDTASLEDARRIVESGYGKKVVRRPIPDWEDVEA